MKLIVKPRQFGKTFDCISWLRGAENRVLIVFHNGEKQRILNEYFKNDDQRGIRKRIFTSREFQYKKRGGMLSVPYEIMVDNVELVLAQLLGEYPTLGTISLPE